jgi:hypothetical protein
MANDGRQTDDWRTGLQISDPDHPAADALQFCEDCEEWTPHRMEDDGAFACIPCVEADPEDIERALDERGL